LIAIIPRNGAAITLTFHLCDLYLFIISIALFPRYRLNSSFRRQEEAEQRRSSIYEQS